MHLKIFYKIIFEYNKSLDELKTKQILLCSMKNIGSHQLFSCLFRLLFFFWIAFFYPSRFFNLLFRLGIFPALTRGTILFLISVMTQIFQIDVQQRLLIIYAVFFIHFILDVRFLSHSTGNIFVFFRRSRIDNKLNLYIQYPFSPNVCTKASLLLIRFIIATVEIPDFNTEIINFWLVFCYKMYLNWFLHLPAENRNIQLYLNVKIDQLLRVQDSSIED